MPKKIAMTGMLASIATSAREPLRHRLHRRWVEPCRTRTTRKASNGFSSWACPRGLGLSQWRTRSVHPEPASSMHDVRLGQSDSCAPLPDWPECRFVPSQGRNVRRNIRLHPTPLAGSWRPAGANAAVLSWRRAARLSAGVAQNATADGPFQTLLSRRPSQSRRRGVGESGAHARVVDRSPR